MNKTSRQAKFKFTCVLLALLFAVSSFFPVMTSAASFNATVYAAVDIIIQNEGNYGTVVKKDVNAVSLGLLGWHATRALQLLQEIVSKNPDKALSVLGPALYNEIITKSNWEGRIYNDDEAARTAVLLTSAEGVEVQNENAINDISGYVSHGERLGITESEALVFFADYQNQNGYTGAENFYYEVVRGTGDYSPNLYELYEFSSKNSRRTRTYNFCASINWSEYSSNPFVPQDSTPPKVNNLKLVSVTSEGYAVSFSCTDNVKVDKVYVLSYYTDSGMSSAKWKQLEVQSGVMTSYEKISDLGGRYGNYTTVVYAIDKQGNYGSASISPVTVSQKGNQTAVIPLSASVSISASKVNLDDDIVFAASASNGSGNYEYEFTLYKDGVKAGERKSSDYPIFTVKADEKGKYYAVAQVKDKTTGKSSEAKSDEIDVYNLINTGELTSDKTQCHTGENITWQLYPSGGEGTLEFQYALLSGNELIESTDYTFNSYFEYTPEKSGGYTLFVRVRDSEKHTEIQRSSTVFVFDRVKMNGVEINKKNYFIGMKVTLSADVEGGSDEKQYRFFIYRDGALLSDSGFISENEFSFYLEKGEYFAEAEVKDGDDDLKAESDKFEVLKKPELGDANLDGKVNASDARLVLRISAKLDKAPENLEYICDVNFDGKINASDARKILRYSARIEELIEKEPESSSLNHFNSII